MSELPMWYSREDAFLNRWPWPPEGAYVPKTPAPLVNPIPAKLLSTADLASIPEPTWIIDQIVATSSLSWIAGVPGSYKSFMAIDWACAVSLGVHTCGGRKTRKTRVLYMAGEGTGGLSKRVEAWSKATGLVPDVTWLPEAVQIGGTDWRWLIDTSKELGVGLLVVDTYARATVGLEEINGADQGRIDQALGEYRAATGAANLVVHHASAAGKTLRGHTSLEGNADKIVTLTKDDNGVVTMCHYKQKETDKEADEYYRPSPFGRSITLTQTDKPVETDKTTTHGKR